MTKYSIFRRYNRRWLTVGMGVKRWLVLLAVGSAVAGDWTDQYICDR